MLPVFFCASVIKHLELVRRVHLGKIMYPLMRQNRDHTYLMLFCIYQLQIQEKSIIMKIFNRLIIFNMTMAKL